SISVQEGTGSL
nr:immunoglobulin heavy chain junction region [Mus musculus]